MTPKMKPLAIIRVRPENRSLYFKVFVWRTLKDLRRANPGNSHTLALCRCETHIYVKGNRRNRVTPLLGTVHFCKYHLRAGIISHEFTHAAIGWAARVGIQLDLSPQKKLSFLSLRRNDPEERFCHGLGEMVRQCVSSLYRKKIIS